MSTDIVFEKRLFSIEEKLDSVGIAISKIAVQKERIDGIEEKVNAVLAKWDKLVDPEDGMLPKLKSKVSTYDDRIKSLKWVLAISGITSIGCAASLFALARHILLITK